MAHPRGGPLFSGERSHRIHFQLGASSVARGITEYVGHKFHLDYNPATEVLVSVGVSEAIDIALRALLNPGDEVLYHEPCYVSYSPSVSLAHGRAVAVPVHEKDNFQLRADELEKRITKKSKVLLLNFPTNPTGATMPREALAAIAEVCRKHDLVVLSDEIYAELTHDGAEHVSIATLPGMRERTVFLHGLSKGWAMTGFRIGYACAPPELIEAMMKIHQYAILCAPITTQDAAVEALRHGEAAVQGMREKYELRRNYITSALEGMGLPCPLPCGAFYVFPDIRSTGLSSRDFAMRLLEEKKVAVVPGPAFGPSGEGFIRCSYATSLEQIKTAMQRMEEFVTSLSRNTT